MSQRVETDSIQEAARTALVIQDASNLSGVLHAWARAQHAIRAATGTNAEYRAHPVNVMFLSKVASLMCLATDCLGGVYAGDRGDVFGPAYDACKRLASEATP